MLRYFAAVTWAGAIVLIVGGTAGACFAQQDAQAAADFGFEVVTTEVTVPDAGTVLVTAQIFAVPEDILEEQPAAEPPSTDEPKKEEKPKEDGDENADASTPAPESPPIDPDVVTLTLADGSKISGKLTVSEIKVDTAFGVLTIPVSKLISFAPGLDSREDFAARVTALIDRMGDPQYSNREQAEKALLAMGPGIREEIRQHLDDKNAEKVKNLKSLLEKISEISDDDEGRNVRPITRKDMVVTSQFTAAGQISPAEFEVISKFGKLTVKLGDIQSLQRPTQRETEVFKSVKVDGNQHIIQKGVLNTKVQVERGDRVTIKADGTIVMSPWGNEYTSGPDGDGNQYGWYVGNSIPGGALVGKIGNSDSPFKVGSSSTFTAKKAGTLYLAIGMNPGQASSSFPGTYNVKIRVEKSPK
ncbi:MAG: hypothetical protein WD875_06975 [Pirellulales bacterium]